MLFAFSQPSFRLTGRRDAGQRLTLARYPPYMATIERESQMTERGRYCFTVKKNTRGEFWIAAEPAGHTIESLDDCVLGFEIEPKATHGHAIAVADFLNSNIVAITLT